MNPDATSLSAHPHQPAGGRGSDGSELAAEHFSEASVRTDPSPVTTYYRIIWPKSQGVRADPWRAGMNGVCGASEGRSSMCREDRAVVQVRAVSRRPARWLMTPPAGPAAHQSGKPVSPLTLPSPLLPAHSPALFLTSIASRSPPLHPPLSVLFHLSPKPPVVILDSPLPAYPTFSSPFPKPLGPPFPN